MSSLPSYSAIASPGTYSSAQNGVPSSSDGVIFASPLSSSPTATSPLDHRPPVPTRPSTLPDEIALISFSPDFRSSTASSSTSSSPVASPSHTPKARLAHLLDNSDLKPSKASLQLALAESLVFVKPPDVRIGEDGVAYVNRHDLGKGVSRLAWQPRGTRWLSSNVSDTTPDSPFAALV